MVGAVLWRTPSLFCVAGAAPQTCRVACFCKLYCYCQGCVKWWQGANYVAGVRHREIVILCGTRSIWWRSVVCGMTFFMAGAVYSTLYAPHLTLYTPHSTLYILHSALHTLNSTLYTLHSILYTPYFTFCTSHFIIYIFIMGLGFRVYDSHCVRYSTLGWVSLCCFNLPAQWSLVIFAFIPSFCSSSFCFASFLLPRFFASLALLGFPLPKRGYWAVPPRQGATPWDGKKNLRI